MDQEALYYVAIIGAGPAGLFAARQLADRNVRTVIFNRDIKPGGLAEYGIYPTKTRMKEGLRNQFRQILALKEIDYYGNILVGEHADLSIGDLRALGFQAQIIAVGAQSPKHLGIPGEDLKRVYHAKDLVYHYNSLPPFSEIDYPIGKRVAVIGAGNVMMDVSRWLIEDQGVEEVTAIARRGPAEVKFDRKELESLAGYLDLEALDLELARVRPVMEAVGQNPQEFRAMIQATVEKGQPAARNACFVLQFLSSPAQIDSDAQGGAASLVVEENALVLSPDGEIRARGAGKYHTLAVDTVIFAIGDVVDRDMGLPVANGEFLKAPQPRFPVDEISYEAYDPHAGQPIADVFLAGWARRPSTGLVGIARKDATNAAQAVLQYLQTQPPSTTPVMHRVCERVAQIDHPVVDKPSLMRLEETERLQAREMNLEYFRYPSNDLMLKALGLGSWQKKQV